MRGTGEGRRLAKSLVCSLSRHIVRVVRAMFVFAARLSSIDTCAWYHSSSSSSNINSRLCILAHTTATHLYTIIRSHTAV